MFKTLKYHKPYKRFVRSHSYVSKCPKPVYDTGCTYCQPPEELKQNLKSPPESVRGTMPLLNKIIVYLSNNGDYKNWPKKIEAYDIMRKMSNFGRGNGNMICLSSLPPRELTKINTEAGFLIFPDAKTAYFDYNNESTYEELFKMINTGDVKKTSLIDIVPVRKITVLICGHAQRDERCGIIGKMVFDEFSRVLEHENLTNDVDLGFISHVGGHVYAGNLAILKPNGTVMWYGMVRPQYVQGIVEKSIKDDIIIEELSRD
jgi:hypothetical protein